MESMRLHIGTLTTCFSQLSVSVSVQENSAGVMTGSVHVYCSENNRDRAGYMILNRAEVVRLRAMLDEGEAKIAGLARTGKLVFMADGVKDQESH